MGFNDGPTDSQPHSHSLPFSSIERFKKQINNLSGEGLAKVLHPD
jgi:hypothetical protein